METAYFILFLLGIHSHVAVGTTSSLVLHLAPSVAAGQTAQYNCSSEGTGLDPTIVWSVKDSSGTVKLSNAQLNSRIVEGATDTTDGKVKSSVSFLVTSEYLSTTHRLWCGAIDAGSSTPSIQIYATIQATTTTTANLGEYCSSSITCAIANSFCDSGTCRCNSGYYDNNGETVQGGSCSVKGGLGSSCQAGNDLSCGTLNSRCSSTSPYVCVCQSGYTQSGSSCIINSAGLMESCVNPSRACYISNSYCNGTICICTSGYVQWGTTCALDSNTAGYQESCINPSRTCTSNLACISGTCQCSSGTVYSSTTGSCVSSTATYGESCLNPTRTCITSNSNCGGSGICVCNSGTTYSSATSTCVSSTAVYGQSCVNPTRTCITTNSVCGSSGVCECTSGYTYSSTVGSCITSTAFYGESCINPTRTCITSNSYCGISGMCVCNSGTTYSSTTSSCVSNTAVYGESCLNPTRTCVTSNSVCGNSGVCECSSGYIYSSVTSTCVTNTAMYGDPCVNPTRTCITSNSNCGGSGTCQCNTGYTYSSTQSACIGNTAAYGESCTNPTRSCVTINSNCGSGGTCQCNSGFIYSSTQSACVTSTAGYGESCTNPTRTCINNAVCNTQNGTCQCSTGYVYSTSTGTCIVNTAGYGEPCTNPTRTCPSNAICNSGTCQCITGYVYSATTGTCVVNTADYGEFCTDPVRTCTGNDTVCTNGTCLCDTGYVYASSNSCISDTAYPGQSCANPTRTCLSSSYCDGSVCRCNSGYYQSSSTACTQKHGLGETCSTSVSDSCSDPNSACVGSTNPMCQCNSGYTNSGGTCTSTSTSTTCPANTNIPSTVTGVSSPVGATTPDVRVGQTCYDVNLFGTQIMDCSDSKGSISLQSARWLKLPDTQIVPTTGQFINGDIATPSLTVSNAQASYAGSYICQLCYGTSYTRCTNSSVITLNVIGTAITSVSVSATQTTPLKGQQVTLTCNTTPSGAATSYEWFQGNTRVGAEATYTMNSIQAAQFGNYTCRATNTYGSVSSSPVAVDVRYQPEPYGGTTLTTVGNFDNGNIRIECSMIANPAVSTYRFYDEQNNLLATTSSNTFSVSSSQGYQTYRCTAENSLGVSQVQYLDVVEDAGGSPSVGAATEDSGIGTGTIAAIVLGIIFFILLLIIIIVCCLNYGWCRKKEKVEPEIIEKPVITQYVPSVSTEEPRYTTPRYHLKPALNGGPIISMYDDSYEQPRAHQLPPLDTQYLYTDDEPKKRHRKKKRKHRHREDVSPRRQHYEADSEPKYAEALPASDEDLVVIPGKQNYFE